ncbi:hypothetical protein Tco_0753500 [Tanacetum coccineum]
MTQCDQDSADYKTRYGDHSSPWLFPQSDLVLNHTCVNLDIIDVPRDDRDLERVALLGNRIAYSRQPPLPLCFQTPQPCTKFNSISYNFENEVDVDSMILEAYDFYIGLVQCSLKSEILVPLRELKPKKTGHEVLNRGDQEDGEIPDLLTFLVTNVFSSVCKQVDENIDISIAREIEEVQVEDIGMDGNHNVDPLNTLETLQ